MQLKLRAEKKWHKHQVYASICLFGFQPVMQLSVVNISFQMISRALKDHILFVADALKKKKRKKRARNDKKAFSHRSEFRNISILCYKRDR